MEQESSEENYEEVDSEAEENDEEEDSEAEEKNEAPKSAYELRQERLKSKIAELEEEAIQPKDWQMLGETKASLRPENALLEEDLVFDQQTRQAPVITEETTRTLEDIIRQRIKDQAFDDVVRKIKPVTDPAEFKQRLVLNQEKSKFSLAEIYEQVRRRLLILFPDLNSSHSSLDDVGVPETTRTATAAAASEQSSRSHRRQDRQWCGSFENSQNDGRFICQTGRPVQLSLHTAHGM